MPLSSVGGVSGIADVLAADVRLDGVPSALAAARDGIDSLLRDGGLRRSTPELTTESLLRGAIASAQLAGSRADVAAARQGTGDAIAEGALLMNGQLLSLVPVVRRSPLQALARMHALAAVEESADTKGRPQIDPDQSARIHALAELFTARVEVPAIALAAVAHAEVVVLAPFRTANDVVARGLERLLLVSTGMDPSSLTVPEAGHAALSDSYGAALASYREGGTEGHRAWLLHAARAVTAGAAASPLVT